MPRPWALPGEFSTANTPSHRHHFAYKKGFRFDPDSGIAKGYPGFVFSRF
jgi:hypothetical protein